MKKISLFVITLCLILTSCAENQSIVNNLDERDANEIIVFLASKGIESLKIKAPSEAAGGGGSILWNISVEPNKSIEALSILNSNGLPRKKGTNLLTLFAKSSLMTTDREETIKYQAGLEDELSNIIMKMDGVLDANVQISFSSSEPAPGEPASKIKAAIYVKHQGIFDDPNNHLEAKVKRLIAGSIEGLDFENVSVISDRSRLIDIKLQPDSELISPHGRDKQYVGIWNMIMTKQSLTRFRVLFFSMISIILAFGACIGFLVYKFYPIWQSSRKKNKSKE